MLWPVAVHRFGATCSGGPNFAYQLLIDRYDPDRLTGVDLRHWRVAFNGSEPVRDDTIRSFAARYRGHGFDARAVLPCYGLAEATLFVAGAVPGTGHQRREVDRRGLEQDRLAPGDADGQALTLVSAGLPARDTEVVIRDAEGRVLPDGHVGEICVRGPGVARGYWNDPDATGAAFQGDLLRTGDLGAFWDGGLYPVGRRKDLLIVAGRNVHPHDVEAEAVGACEELRGGSAAAFQPDPATPGVVLVAEVARSALSRVTDEVVAAVQRTAMRAVGIECGVQLAEVVLVGPGTLPKTSSGKIRRAETRERYLSGRLRSLRPQPCTEPADAAPDVGTLRDLHTLDTADRAQAVHRLLTSLLAAHGAPTLDGDDHARPLTMLGLDSLRTAAVKVGCERALCRPLDTGIVAGERSLDEVTEAITTLTATPPPAMTGVTGSTTVAATDGQRQLQFAHDLLPDDTANNLPIAVRLSRRFEPAVVRAAVTAVAQRHTALRTVLGSPGSGRQLVRDGLRPDWAEREFGREDGPELTEFLHREAYRRFALTEGPLLRAAVAVTPVSTILLVTAHHAIVDHWSLRAVLTNVLRRLPGVKMPGDDAAPSDITAWAAATAARLGETGARLDTFAERWHPLRNHLLFPAPAPVGVRRNPAGVVDFDVPGAAGLYERSRRRGHTPFVTVATAYLNALHRVTGAERIVIGSPYHGRDDWRFADTVGYLVNMIPLAGDFAVGEEPATLEARTAAELHTAQEFADLPIARLIRQLGLDRHGQHPLFQATLTLQQSADSHLDDGFSVASSGCRETFGDVEVAVHDIPPRDVAFAVSLYGARHHDRMVFRLVHQTRVVEYSVAQAIADDVRSSLAAAADPTAIAREETGS
jgi:hypothetical protein